GIFRSRRNREGGDTNSVYIRRRANRPPGHWARKSRTRAGGRWSRRSRALADRPLRRKATDGHHAAPSSRESPRRYTISPRDKRSDNRPLARRAPEIGRPDI